MRWAVVITLKDGVELLRKEFNAGDAADLTRAFRQVTQAVMDDGAMLSPGEMRIDVVKPGADVRASIT